MTKVKRIIAMALLIATFVSCLAVLAEAKYVTMYSYYSNYATATLQNKRKDGYVNIVTYPTTPSAVNVKLTTTGGRYIWSQTRAISFGGSRVFRLGCNYSAYRVYVSTYCGRGCTGGCYINPWSNVTVR